MKKPSILILLTFFAFTLEANALSPREILKKSDELILKVKDQTYDAKMTVYEQGELIKTVEMTIVIKGLFKKLIRFTSPSELKGMGVLTLENNVMYVYLPSYKKIKRVASHVRHQGFFGSDFDYDDMSQSAFSEFYDAALISENDREWKLKLTPKKGKDAAWARLDMTILKKSFVVSEIACYSESGKMMKIQKRSNFKEYSGHPLCTRIEIHSKTSNHHSVLEFFNVRSNTGVSDSLFKKRTLLRRH